MPFIYDDGGRAAAGYRGEAGCGVFEVPSAARCGIRRERKPDPAPPDPVLLTWAEAESAAYRLAGLAPADDERVQEISREVCGLLLKLDAAVRDARK